MLMQWVNDNMKHSEIDMGKENSMRMSQSDSRPVIAASSMLLALTAMLLGACTVGPDYVKPEVQTPAAFKEQGDWVTANPQDKLPKGKWWELFGDTELNSLVEQVEISNQNIKVAEAQYRQARA